MMKSARSQGGFLSIVRRCAARWVWGLLAVGLLLGEAFAAPPVYYDSALIPERDLRVSTQVCIYGATPAGISALLECSRLGISAVLLHPGTRIGGMSASGLGSTDTGKKDAIGGISREFYRRVGAYYGVAEEWSFEPKAALSVFNDMIREAGQPVYSQAWVQSVRKNGSRLEEVTCLGGLRVTAKYFIDCSYEGDLGKAAGVAFRLGRESNALHREEFNGQQMSVGHQFDVALDPYKIPGQPESGLLFGVDASSDYVKGAADARLQAYNFRMCLTQRLENGLPFDRPADYDSQRYELLRRYVTTSSNPIIWNNAPVRNGKTDTNNNGPFSTDFIGGSERFPEASYEERERIYQAHVSYQKGWLWFLRNDPSVPQALRAEFAQWRLAKDEFVETDGWPSQLYIRESRRLVGENTITEAVCMGRTPVTDSVGLGSYTMDSHNCRRFVQNGRVRNEGDVQVLVPQPYGISYRALLPRRTEAENLLVPVCLSATHVAFGSVRMEPVYMILGQSAAAACSIALESGQALQDVSYTRLRSMLLRRGQLLGGELPARLTNISSRHLAAPQRPLILGWNTSGGAGRLLARTAGPSLRRFGVERPVEAVSIACYTLAGALLLESSRADAAVLAASLAVGAFALEFAELEGAVLLSSVAGGSLVASAPRGDTGEALAEIYVADLTGGFYSFSNLSTRVSTEAGRPLIVGFTVVGAGEVRLVLRAIGPALRQFGVSDAAEDVALTIYDGQGRVLASNQDWSLVGDASSIRSAFSAVGAFPLAAGSKDAALLLTLPAGSYSAHSSVPAGLAGQVMFEAYDLGP